MKILLVQTAFLGDVVLSTPVISGLRQIFPKAEISLLCTKQAKSLLEHHPELTEVMVYDKRGVDAGVKGFMRLAGEIRSREFSLAVSLHKSARSALLLWRSGVPKRFGFRESALWWTYTKTIQRVRKNQDAHDVIRNLRILELFGSRVQDLPQEMKIYPGSLASQRARELLSDARSRLGVKQKLVGVAPGSVWPMKRWTEQGFASLIGDLCARGLGVVLLGGPEDLELSANILRGVSAEHTAQVTNLVGKTSLAESAAVVGELSVLVSNDSAPLHLASAMQTPVVSIFCATVPEFGYGPWMVPHEIIEFKALSCRPCHRHGGKNCPTGTHACRKGVTPGEVVSAVFRLIEQSERHHANG